MQYEPLDDAFPNRNHCVPLLDIWEGFYYDMGRYGTSEVGRE